MWLPGTWILQDPQLAGDSEQPLPLWCSIVDRPCLLPLLDSTASHTHLQQWILLNTDITSSDDDDDITLVKRQFKRPTSSIYCILYQGQTHTVCFHSSWQVSLSLSASFHWTPPRHLWCLWPPGVEWISPLDSLKVYTVWKQSVELKHIVYSSVGL